MNTKNTLLTVALVLSGYMAQCATYTGKIYDNFTGDNTEVEAKNLGEHVKDTGTPDETRDDIEGGPETITVNIYGIKGTILKKSNEITIKIKELPNSSKILQGLQNRNLSPTGYTNEANIQRLFAYGLLEEMEKRRINQDIPQPEVINGNDIITKSTTPTTDRTQVLANTICKSLGIDIGDGATYRLTGVKRDFFKA